MYHWKLWAALAASAVWLNSAAAQSPVVIALPGEPVSLQADEKKEGDKPEKVAAPMEAAPAADASCCGSDCGKGKGHKCKCPIVWCRPWTCADLEMKPFEPVAKHCCKCHLLWCVKDEKKNGNGNGEKKNGDDKKDEKKDEKKEEGKKDEAKKDEKKEEKKNGEAEEKKEEEPKTKTPLMQIIECCSPCKYERMQKKGDNFYGWVELGYTANFDSPSDRINFGTNFNWRSNDFQMEQVYFVYENALEHDDKANVGYRVDFYAGAQAPFQVALGLFDSFTGYDLTSGYGVDGPASFRQLNRVGIDLPQFYLNAHIPHCLTEKGIDILVGKFWTLLGHEVYPAPLMEFYSMSYEIIYATPFTHTGILTTFHLTDTLDMTAGIVRGNDVFEDNNQRPSYIGNFIWNSCDKRYNWTTAWVTGPEQPDNNDNYRTVVTSYVTALMGDCNQWKFIFGGNASWEANAALDPATGGLNDAEWYGAAAYLFYTVDPRLILGTRAEWWRDDDGVRTAVTKRPGFAGNFFEVTLGATYKMRQNLRIRPELRFDWFDGVAVDGSGALPYNDLRDTFQATAAIDMIWEF